MFCLSPQNAIAVLVLVMEVAVGSSFYKTQMALASMLTTKTSIGLDFGNMLFLDFSAGYPEVRMMPVSCGTAHYIKELNKDTNLLVL